MAFLNGAARFLASPYTIVGATAKVYKLFTQGASVIKLLMFLIYTYLLSYSLIREYLRGKYHCTIDFLFDWFGLVCFAYKIQKLSVVIQLIPNQSNRRSIVQ